MKKRPKVLNIESKEGQLLQKLLPLFSSDVTLINELVGFCKRDDTVYYFNGQMPIFHHDETDLESFKMYMAQLYIEGTTSQSEINRVFGLNPINMKRWVKKYTEGGPGAFYKKERKTNPRVLTLSVLKEVQQLLDAGNLPSEVGKKLGLKTDTLRKAIRAGKVHQPALKKTAKMIRAV